jgi:hypothetical protein
MRELQLAWNIYLQVRSASQSSEVRGNVKKINGVHGKRNGETRTCRLPKLEYTNSGTNVAHLVLYLQPG